MSGVTIIPVEDINDVPPYPSIVEMVKYTEQEYFPWASRHDAVVHNTDIRVITVIGMYMKAMNYSISELRDSSLIGLHDHKGILVSVWEGMPSPEEIAVIKDAWGAMHEETVFVVTYFGEDNEFNASYETRYSFIDKSWDIDESAS